MQCVTTSWSWKTVWPETQQFCRCWTQIDEENWWKLLAAADQFWPQSKAAYKKWTSLIMEEPGSWIISRPKTEDGLTGHLQHGLAESIKDALGVKATSTLHGRANPLLRFVQFAKHHNVPPFPMQEGVAYSFLKDNDTAPTFPRSFITSVAFAKHVLGLLHTDEILDSSRIKGYAAIHFSKKRKLVQRPPLTVQQIQHLENCVNCGDRTMYDRIASGFFLLLTFGRLRFADGQSISSMELEIPLGAGRGYLECSAERCKTSTSLEKRTRFLPVVIPTLSFTENGWIEQWIKCREQQGLTLGAGKPLLPTPAAGGGWSKVPVSCEVAGDWLRALLKDVPSKASKVRIATHSCKSAVLSMCQVWHGACCTPPCGIPLSRQGQEYAHLQPRCNVLANQTDGRNDPADQCGQLYTGCISQWILPWRKPRSLQGKRLWIHLVLRRLQGRRGVWTLGQRVCSRRGHRPMGPWHLCRGYFVFQAQDLAMSALNCWWDRDVVQMWTHGYRSVW